MVRWEAANIFKKSRSERGSGQSGMTLSRDNLQNCKKHVWKMINTLNIY